jgi:hypothetical protein
MSDATRAFFGSWPEFYDRLMVPLNHTLGSASANSFQRKLLPAGN